MTAATEEKNNEQEIITILYQMEVDEEDEEHAVIFGHFTDTDLMFKKIDDIMNDRFEGYITKDDLFEHKVYYITVPMNVIDEWMMADSMDGDYGSTEIDMKKLYPKQYEEFNRETKENSIRYHREMLAELEKGEK